MKERIIKYLCCPKCKSDNDLKLQTADVDKVTNHIIEGSLICPSCNIQYPIKNGVPFFGLDNIDPTVDLNRKNFADEWLYFTSEIDHELAKDELDSYFQNLITYEDLRDKMVLDAGCGGGRFCHAVAQESKAKEIFAVDLSNATLSAFKNTKHFDNVNIIQGDIMNLPFKNKPFDFIYSVGVIHHLPDPKAGFTSLTKHLKKDGKILAWVYGKEGNALYIYLADPIRKLITSKLPFSINLILSFLITCVLWAIIWIIYIPKNKFKISNKILPFNEYFIFFKKRGFREFWRTVIDKMIPTISYYISKDEFTDWFTSNNLNHNILFRNEHSWSGLGEFVQKSNTKENKTEKSDACCL
ncbi:MAG: methyltransferase domain-containing protein [Candidatus Melainabacteria bacterium]|nr:methyltransferase domain-containing protein [Candidatus Melainabacteria bacterium]